MRKQQQPGHGRSSPPSRLLLACRKVLRRLQDQGYCWGFNPQERCMSGTLRHKTSPHCRGPSRSDASHGPRPSADRPATPMMMRTAGDGKNHPTKVLFLLRQSEWPPGGSPVEVTVPPWLRRSPGSWQVPLDSREGATSIGQRALMQNAGQQRSMVQVINLITTPCLVST